MSVALSWEFNLDDEDNLWHIEADIIAAGGQSFYVQTSATNVGGSWPYSAWADFGFSDSQSLNCGANPFFSFHFVAQPQC